MHATMTAGLMALALLAPTAQAAPAPAAPPATGLAALTPPPVRRDPREQIPEGFLGLWKADLTASKYGFKPPRHYLRQFEYTRDGMLQVSFIIQYVDGTDTAGHWAVRPDGSPGIEYRREWGSSPYAEVSLKMVDARTFALTSTRNGRVSQGGGFKLSEDGQTLTQTFGAAAPDQYLIYRRWTDRQ